MLGSLQEMLLGILLRISSRDYPRISICGLVLGTSLECMLEARMKKEFLQEYLIEIPPHTD